MLDSLPPGKDAARRAVDILTLRYMEILPSTALKWFARCNRGLKDSGNRLLLAGVGHHVFDLPGHTGVIHAAMESGRAWLEQNQTDSI